MLEVKDIHTFYGLSHILFGVSVEVKEGQVVCLLGRNGAGKSTTMKSIIGLNPPREGKIIYKGEDITKKKPYQRARRGIGYVPDERRIFADLTVEENLEIAERRRAEKIQWTMDRVYELFPSLRRFSKRRAGFLSGGEQKMLAIGRALMGNPKLLLLDEPTEGLAPLLVKEFEERIHTLKEMGLTVLLAEQNVKFTFSLSDYGYIIENGRIYYEGDIEDMKDNEEVRIRCGIG